jgi:hypothetical protein
MGTFLKNLFYDPFVGKIVAAFLGIIVINVLVRFLQRTLAARIKEKNARYGLRRWLAFFGYLAAVLLLAAIFSDQFSSLTVALGVAGAGIAFALQEVIASVAGWIALSFGQFYAVGDRVQLGGIKGDVIDIGVLRTTLMEIGEWVIGDQYNGRIVRVANSFVFKEPVYNYSADFPFVWDEITVPIKYGSDHTLARKIIQDAAQKVVSEYVAFAHQTWQNILRKYAIEDASVNPSSPWLPTIIGWSLPCAMWWISRNAAAQKIYSSPTFWMESLPATGASQWLRQPFIWLKRRCLMCDSIGLKKRLCFPKILGKVPVMFCTSFCIHEWSVY